MKKTRGEELEWFGISVHIFVMLLHVNYMGNSNTAGRVVGHVRPMRSAMNGLIDMNAKSCSIRIVYSQAYYTTIEYNTLVYMHSLKYVKVIGAGTI